MFLSEKVTVRLSKKAFNEGKNLIKKYPADYKNLPEVLRSGIFALKTFKKKAVFVKNPVKIGENWGFLVKKSDFLLKKNSNYSIIIREV